MDAELLRIFENSSSEKHYAPNTYSIVPSGKTNLNITSGQNANWTYANFFIENGTDKIESFKINEGQFVILKKNNVWCLYDYRNNKVAEGLDAIEVIVNKIVEAESLRLKMLDDADDANSKKRSLQLIYFGAPGTSKSTTIKKKVGKSARYRITFHPDTDYSNFVGCYKPTKENKIYGKEDVTEASMIADLTAYYNDTQLGNVGGLQKFAIEYAEFIDGEHSIMTNAELKNILQKANVPQTYDVEIKKYTKLYRNLLKDKLNNGQITYEFVAQTFTKAYVEAWKKLHDDNDSQKEVFLIIEEINRGNCAQIFGDLFQLLDRNEKGYSEYDINPDSDLTNYLEKAFSAYPSIPENIRTGKKMLLPPNLYIWATMNTSDQSLFPIDSAFKRRWDWKYLPINEAKGKDGKTLKHKVRISDKESFDWWEFLEAVNERIEKLTESEDKQMGYWFAKPDNGKEISIEKFVSKVIFYLWNDVFKDFGNDGNSPFVIKAENNEEGNKRQKLTFRSFFDEEGNEKADIVRLFVKNLKTVDIVEDANPEENANPTPQQEEVPVVEPTEPTDSVIYTESPVSVPSAPAVAEDDDDEDQEMSMDEILGNN